MLFPNDGYSGPSAYENNIKGVFDEYRMIFPDILEKYCPIGAPGFPVAQELNPHSWTNLHSNYINYLFKTKKNVLIQPVRANYHLENLNSISKNIKYIWILRDSKSFVSSIFSHSKNLLSYWCVVKRLR